MNEATFTDVGAVELTLKSRNTLTRIGVPQENQAMRPFHENEVLRVGQEHVGAPIFPIEEELRVSKKYARETFVGAAFTEATLT